MNNFNRWLWGVGQAAGIMLILLNGLAPVQAQSDTSTTPSENTQDFFTTPNRLSAGDYVLGAGDRLRIEVFNVPDYSREYQILSDGTLSLPLIGVVSVQGLTLTQAIEAVTERYARYIRNPTITLELVAARSLRIAIAGEVNRPGTYILVPDAISGVVSVTQALQDAGGITQLANIRQIKVQRRQIIGQPASAPFTANLWNLVTRGDLSQDLTLQDGDTIIVPTVQDAIEPAEVPTLASASFSPDSISVNVVGEVYVPGSIQVPPNTPLNQALLAAGGFNDDAKNDEVTLIRLNPNGSVSQLTIPIDFAQGVNEQTNPPLRPNDTIVVSESGRAEFGDSVNAIGGIIGALLSPFTGVFNLLKLSR